MGVVARQASLATFFNYLGVLIGFVNVTLLMTNWFSTDQFGLRSILLDIAVIYSQIAHLGTYRSLVKFFPLFNRQGKGDNGLLFIGLLVPLLGFLVIAAALFLGKDFLIGHFSDRSSLFEQFFWFIFPLSFLLLYNNVFESYLQARSVTAYSAFLKSVLNRLLTSMLLFFYYLDWIDFYGFIVGFVLSYLLNILLFTIYLYSRGELNFKPPRSFFRKKLRKVYLNYSFYGILSGSSSVLINKIDAVMIGFIIGLTPTGIYSLSVYLSILIFIPADAIGKISFPLLSRSWKEKRFDQIDELYKKSSLNQFLIGGILFVLLWSNLDNFYSLQKPIYAEGRMALLFLGLARVINMLFGVNGQIINVSKFYRFDTTTSVLLAILTIVTNLIFIPLYGISGAALATAVSIVLFNVVRFAFVYHKLQLQPFSFKTLVAAALLLLAFFLGQYLPELDSIILDGIYRSLIIGGSFGLLVYFTKVSEDFNHYFNKLIKP